MRTRTNNIEVFCYGDKIEISISSHTAKPKRIVMPIDDFGDLLDAIDRMSKRLNNT